MESLTDLCWAGSEEAVKTRAAAMSGAFFMFILGAAAVGALWADDAVHCKSPMLRFALLLSLAASCGGTSPRTQLPAGGVWRALAPMPEARQELASAALGGKIFVIAGFDSGGEATNSVFVYDPASNGWSRAAPLPIVNEHPGAAVAHGTLFAFGGRSPRVFAYDAGRDAWSEVASMSFQHGSTPAVGVLDDRIYVAGGEGGIIGSAIGNNVYLPGGARIPGFAATSAHEVFAVE